jgi:catechol 2,3-dioxygenase-like lactoylglutathione lyase family enzyme
VLDDRGDGLLALAFGCDDVAGFSHELRECGVDIAEPEEGEGRDRDTGAVRRWSNAMISPAATRGIPLFAIEHHSPPDALPLVAPEGDPAAAPSSLDHVVVISGDTDASRAIYGDQLGLRLALDREFEKRRIRLMFFRVGGVTVEVGGALSGGDPDEPDRFGGLAYWVDDVDAARVRLAALDFDVSEVRAGHKPGTRVCSVRDGTCGVPTLLKGPD